MSIRYNENNVYILQNKKQHYFKIADGGKSEWIGDGFCDDMNNQELCDYDYGDCCGAFKQIHFCMKCECISKLIFTYNVLPTFFHTFF